MSELATVYGTRDDLTFLGPFTLPQVMMLLYGIKKFVINATFAGTYNPPAPAPSDPRTGSASLTVTAKLGSGASYAEANEHTNFETSVAQGGYFSTVFDDFDIANTPDFNAAVSPIGTDFRTIYTHGYSAAFSPPLDVVKDENGKYWLDGHFFVDIYDADDEYIGYITNIDKASPDPWELPLTVVLRLTPGRSNEIDLNCLAVLHTGAGDDVMTSATCSISASEWYPYQTTAGVAAFVTSTGAIANGGPGA